MAQIHWVRPVAPADPAATQLAIDRELGLVQGAVALVASAGASRVTLCGLRFGARLLEPARDLARGSGVRVRPLRNADDSGLDLCVEADRPVVARS